MKTSFHKSRLLTPGPTMIPERVQRAMNGASLYHRGPEFKPLFLSIQKSLQRLFGTSQSVLTLASSGTGAMEACLTNLCAPQDKVIVIDGGKFGERWTKLAEAFGLKPVIVKVEWGQPVSVDQIKEVYQKNPDARVLFMQACETSTGVVHPTQDIARWKTAQASDLLLCVDGITAVGAMPLPMDAWGVDVLITGSQKALMLPPGLAFIALSNQAWKRASSLKSKIPRFYFDLIREHDNQKEGTTAWTPAISLVMGLKEVMAIMEEEGFDQLYHRHQRLAHATRAAGQALGFPLLSPQAPSDSITAFKVSHGVDGSELVKAMRTLGWTIAGGQDHLKGKIFRLGHMGYVDCFDMVGAFAALELALIQLKYPLKTMGLSTSAFLQAWGASV